MSRILSSEEKLELQQMLSLEATFRLAPEIMDHLLDGGKVISLKTYDPMIDTGEFNPDVYVVKSGLIRGTYLDRNTEKTAGFALSGSLLISFHCYYGNEPSYYRFEACCPSEVVRISHDYFNAMLDNSHDFTKWVMSAHQNQLYYNESKNMVLSGDAKSRLIQLTQRLSGLLDTTGDKKRDTDMLEAPVSHDMKVKSELFGRWRDIFRIVPSKIIASYIGITEQHLSKIKRELLKS